MKYHIIIVTALLLKGVFVPVSANDNAACDADISRAAFEQLGVPLLQREKPDNKTSGRVPHVQINAVTDDAINRKLDELAYSLPGVEKKPTVVSLPGALGMWLTDDIPVKRADTIISGREFSHIHTDGSLHAPLPYERALEVAERGWGELHPWADRFDGWEGLVMLFSPRSDKELAVVFQLIIESYNHVTGSRFGLSGC